MSEINESLLGRIEGGAVTATENAMGSHTLRDKFAMAALTGLLSEANRTPHTQSTVWSFIGAPPGTSVNHALPAACYAIADAMLAERAKRK